MAPTRSRRLIIVGCVLSFLFLCPSFDGTLIPPSFLDRVVAIGRKEVNPVTGQAQWIAEASGFLYGEFLRKIDEKQSRYLLFLVTNRHVIEDHATVTRAPLSVKFNLVATGSAREYDIPLLDEHGKPMWRVHPNPAVDVAIIAINGQFLQSEGARFDYFQSDNDLLMKKQARELGLSEGDGVFVLGFPMGLVGQQQDYVIVRQGAIARVRDTLESSAGESFLIDSLIFPGNSGGPVVLRPDVVSIQGAKPAIDKALLIGVVKGYLPYTDMAVSPQTKHVRVTFEENSGLAEVIPIDYVEEVVQEYKNSLPPSAQQ